MKRGALAAQGWNCIKLSIVLLSCLAAQLEARTLGPLPEDVLSSGQLPQRGRLRRLEEEPEYDLPDNWNPEYIGVFSALHDPIAGEVRVFLEMATVDSCDDIKVCELRRNGTDEMLSVKGEPVIAFGITSDNEAQRRTELRECYITCTLPRPGLKFDIVTVRTQDSRASITALLEETEDLPHGKDKGVGICLAPLYSETPFMSDFLSWYTEMGVDHFYLYASINSWITDRDHPGYYHHPASAMPLHYFHDHRLTWRVFYISEFSRHYYGQTLMYNDCAFRARNTMKYLMFFDRDEFLHIKERHPNIRHFLNRHFNRPEIGSITFHGAVYKVHCGFEDVPVMDALPGKPTAADKSTQVPKYWGYTAWDVDHREPNFTGCYDFDCHPKTVVRPEAVKVEWIHYLKDTYDDKFPIKYQMVNPALAFIKHFQCQLTGAEWDLNPEALLCDEESLNPTRIGRVVMCPENEVAAYREGTWPEGAKNKTRWGSAAAQKKRRRSV